MIRNILYSSIILLVLISTASATSSLTIGTPTYSSTVLKDDSFTVSVSLEAASVTSQISVTITLTDNTNGVSITGAEQTKTFSSDGTQNIQWSVRANNPGTYSNPFTITATANDGGTASPKTSTTSLSIKDRPVLTANVTQNVTSVSANGYVQLSYTITNVASADAGSATNINATLSTIPSGWTAISTTNHSISSLSAGGSQTSGFFIVKASSSAASYNLNMTITSAEGDSLSKGWTVTVTSSGSSTSVSSSGGGGGGGGGGGSAENFNNIELKEKYEEMIYKDKITSYKFKNASSAVTFVNITGNVNAGLINTALELLKGRSSLVNVTAPGIVYKNFNVWVGTTGFVSAKNIQGASIGFRVLNSWLADNGIGATDIRLVRWDGTKWVQLETAQTGKDSIYTYFEAKTTAFANFVITGLKGEIVPTATPESQASGQVTAIEKTPVATGSKKGTPGFEFALSAAVLSMLYLFVRSRR